MKVVMGIDPGIDGAFCLLNQKYEVLFKSRMPLLNKQLDLHAIADLLKESFFEHKPDLVLIEQAFVMPKQSSQSGLTTGKNYGALLGVLSTLNARFIEVRPNEWTKHLSKIKAKEKGARYKASKERNLLEVKRLFPGEELIFEGCRTPHSGLVDALLIARHGLSL